MNPPQATNDQESLRNDFRCLTTLLTVVMAINNNGHPTLKLSKEPKSDSDPKKASYQGPFDRPQEDKSITLNAVASILVRDVEIVAVVARTADGPVTDQVIALAQDASDQDPEPQLQDLSKFALGGFTAVSNPDTKKKRKARSSGISQTVVVTSGVSYLKEVLKAPFKQQVRSLADHAATVTDYLNNYRKYTDDARLERHIHFTRYLVGQCWPKMHRRINHWSSHGFIYVLGNVANDDVQQAYKKWSATNIPTPQQQQSDSVLANMIHDLADWEVARLMKGHPGWQTRNVAIPHLRAAIKQQPSRSRRMPYDEATCVDFHNFFVAVLNSYREALADLKSKKGQANLNKSTAWAWTLAMFLWRIAYSNILNDHLIALDESAFLSIPGDARIQEYMHYTSTDYTETERPEKDSEGQNLDSDEQYEFDGLRGSSRQAKRPNVLRFFRWTRLQVSHFKALDILSKFSRHRTDVSGDIRVSVLTMAHSRSTVMTAWEDMVLKVWEGHPKDSTASAQSVLELLKRLIQEFDGKNPPSNVLKAFCKAVKEAGGAVANDKHIEVAFAGNVHCEAVLALIAKLLTTDEFDDDVKEALKDSDLDALAVSKLCCPICDLLLASLRKQKQAMYVVRGSHATMGPVDLPVWTPIDVMQEMVQKCKEYLGDALTTMVAEEGQQEDGNRRPSFQSDGGFSSDDSDKLDITRYPGQLWTWGSRSDSAPTPTSTSKSKKSKKSKSKPVESQPPVLPAVP